MVFTIDASNYQAHVFAGLAALQLGRQPEAKQHYQSAIDIAPQEQLAWKVLSPLLSNNHPHHGICIYREWVTCIIKV